MATPRNDIRANLRVDGLKRARARVRLFRQTVKSEFQKIDQQGGGAFRRFIRGARDARQVAGRATRGIARNLGRVSSAAGRAGGRIAAMTGRLGAAVGRAGLLATKISAIAGGSTAAAFQGGVIASVWDMAEGIKSATDAADRANISLRNMAGLQLGAERLGFDRDAVEDSILTLQERVAEELEAGAGRETPLSRAAERLGIDPQDLLYREDGSRRDIEEVLGGLAKGFREVKDASAKSLSAGELFGDEGRRIFLTLLEKGPERLEKLSKEAKEMGFGWTREDDQLAESLLRTFSRLGIVFDKIRKKVFRALGPDMKSNTKDLIGFLRANIDKISSGIISLYRGIRDFALSVLDQFRSNGEFATAWIGDAIGRVQQLFRFVQGRVLPIMGNLISDINALASGGKSGGVAEGHPAKGGKLNYPWIRDLVNGLNIALDWVGRVFDGLVRLAEGKSLPEGKYPALNKLIDAAGKVEDGFNAVVGAIKAIKQEIRKTDRAFRSGKFAQFLGSIGRFYQVQTGMEEPEKLSLPKRASGGPIRGPGGPRSDSILARVSNGEYVMNAGAVKAYGERFMDAINSMQLPSTPAPGFADGGLVGATSEMKPASTGPSGRPVHLHLPSGNTATLYDQGDAVDRIERDVSEQIQLQSYPIPRGARR